MVPPSALHRAQFYEPVATGEQDRVMLDDEHAVTRVDDCVKGAGQHGNVGGLQPDGRFIEDVESAGAALGEKVL